MSDDRSGPAPEGRGDSHTPRPVRVVAIAVIALLLLAIILLATGAVDMAPVSDA